MLEIGIIICLTVILFLLLRHFPETGESHKLKDTLTKKDSKMFNFFSKLKKDKTQEAIMGEISKGQENIVTPVDISSAQKNYSEEDPQIATLLLQAEEALLQNDLRLAEESAIDILGKNKKCAQAYVIIGKVAFSRGSYADAKESYGVALRCNPDLAEGYFGLGELSLREENYSDAIEKLQKAVSINRGIAEWHAVLGRAYMEVRQYAKAAKSFKKAANLDIDTREYKDLATQAESKLRTHSSVFRSHK